MKFCLVLCVLFGACYGLIGDAFGGSHVIVAYDVSQSMIFTGDKVWLREKDVKRLNGYVTDILFVAPPTEQAEDDVIINKLPPEPLYKEADKLSFFLFAEFPLILETQMFLKRGQFSWKLAPNLEHFNGVSSFLHRAEMKVYELTEIFYAFNLKSESTYWVLISDKDEDRGVEGRETLPQELHKLAALKEGYTTRLVYQLLVNRHVFLEVYRILPKGVTPAPAVVKQTSPTKTVPVPRKRSPVARKNSAPNPLPAILITLLFIAMIGGVAIVLLVLRKKQGGEISFQLRTVGDVFPKQENFTLRKWQTLGFAENGRYDWNDFTFDVVNVSHFLVNKDGILVLQTVDGKIQGKEEVLAMSDHFTLTDSNGREVEIYVNSFSSAEEENEEFDRSGRGVDRDRDPLSY